MPGGAADAYELVRPYLESVAAKNHEGQPCCAYISTGGSGHYVKMIHNGIEYAEMQLIAEVYGILRHALDYKPDEIAAIFSKMEQEKNNLPIGNFKPDTGHKDRRHMDYWQNPRQCWQQRNRRLDCTRQHWKRSAFSTSVAALFTRFLSADWKWKNLSEQIKRKDQESASWHQWIAGCLVSIQIGQPPPGLWIDSQNCHRNGMGYKFEPTGYHLDQWLYYSIRYDDQAHGCFEKISIGFIWQSTGLQQNK